MNRRPALEIVALNASPEEAAAVVAALEQFGRDHAPVLVPEEPTLSAWKSAALSEGVNHAPDPRAVLALAARVRRGSPTAPRVTWALRSSVTAMILGET